MKIYRTAARTARAIIIITAALLLTACGGGRYGRMLADVESCIQERPDSALTVLENIDRGQLRTEELRARHAVLLAQARDKNYIDETDDSLIRIAVDYYKDSRDYYHAMLSYYYLARIQENAHAYSNAIVNLLKAENLASITGDHFFLGMIYRSFSNIYCDIFNNVESLSYAREAYSQFVKSGREDYIDWALWDVGRAYHNCMDYESSLRTANSIIKTGSAKADDALIIDGMKLSGMSYYADNRFDEAISVYSGILESYPDSMGADDYRNLGLSYLSIGQEEKAEYYTALVASIDSTQKWLPYKISKQKGDYKSALAALENEHEYQDSVLRTMMNQNVTEAVSDYRDYEIIMREKDFQHENTMKFMLIIVLIIIIITGIVIFCLWASSRKKEIDRNMSLISDLRSMLQVKEIESLSLQDTFSRSIKSKDVENSALQDLVNSLFAQRFETIDRLCCTYYESHGTVNEQHRIYVDVMKLVSGLGTDRKTLNELEKFVNTYRENLMLRFRNTFPDLKESDYILYLYLVVGFSPRAISVLLNEKIEVVYNRKSRLKQRINNSAVCNKDVFCRCL